MFLAATGMARFSIHFQRQRIFARIFVGNFRKILQEMSSDQNPGYLLYEGDYTTQFYRDDNNPL